MMLKYVDILQRLQAAKAVLRLPSTMLGEMLPKLAPEAARFMQGAKVADALRDTICLWGRDQGGIALLDEVDLLLHPLKSELNFPIGQRQRRC